ncbi:hypothetical protein [Catellatospora methionotrophica]|uniref:hypothetical protein n=1 Tax=Catellatospora methionotrophica TaxID=121620 RepID=UPI0033F1CF53
MMTEWKALMTILNDMSAAVEGASPAPRPMRRKHVSDRLTEVRSTADWDRPEAAYGQIVHIAEDPETCHLPVDVGGRLAEALSEISPNYRGREALMVEHAQVLFAQVDGHETFDDTLFESLYVDERFSRFHDGRSARRLPTPFETVVETCRRLRDARAVRDALSGLPMSGILAGSASYGQFYNVRGWHSTQDASDLDMVVVVDNADVLAEVADRLRGVAGIDRNSVDNLRQRTNPFCRLYDDDQTAFSHKLVMWNHTPDLMMPLTRRQTSYLLSVHFLTRPVLDFVLVSASAKLTRDATGAKRTVRDYRDTTTGRKDHQRTFAGRGHPMGLETEDAAAGHLRHSRIYFIDDRDAYCPGLLQNILLPRPEILWDDLQVRDELAKFRSKVMSRLRYERHQRPHELLQLSLSHPRRDYFAPHIVREIDTDSSSG